MRVDVPAELWAAAEESPGFAEMVEWLNDSQRAVIAVNGGGRTNPHLIVNEARFRRADIGKEAAAEATLRIINELEQVAGAAADPCLKAALDVKPSDNKAILKPIVSVGLPEQMPDHEIALAATRAMVGMARGLRYEGRNKSVPQVVQARVNRRESRISLIVNSREGRFVRSGTMSRFVGTGQALLTEARLCSHEEQLIGFTGAVALAHADEIIAKG